MTETPLKDPTPVRPKAAREPLTIHDRCDKGKCGAQAYVRVNITLTSSLLFCGHHWDDVRGPKFDKYDIQDETALINKKRDTE